MATPDRSGPVRRRATGAWVVVVQTLLRLFPFPSRTGLMRVGDPGRDSPVLLTGNFGLTVHRVRRAVSGLDAWLLVANSRGVNVWCAATGGLLTDHDVTSVLKTSGIGDQVDHREVVLPQLAATGIDGRRVRRRTGWTVRWGPVEATDLPAYLDGGDRQGEPTGPQSRAVRTVTFGWRRRLEMAVAWAFPLSLLSVVLLPVGVGAMVGAAALVWTLALIVYASFPLYERWLRATTRRSVAGLTVDAGQLALVVAMWLALMAAWLGADALDLGVASHITVAWAVGALAVLLVLGLDLSGSTPVYKSGLHADRLLDIALDDERCRGAGFCAQVCPKDVFEIDRERRLAVLAHPTECVQCGACIVQCPFDALSFRAGDGTVVPPEVIREFKLNLMGARSGAPTTDDHGGS